MGVGVCRGASDSGSRSSYRGGEEVDDGNVPHKMVKDLQDVRLEGIHKMEG